MDTKTYLQLSYPLLDGWVDQFGINEDLIHESVLTRSASACRRGIYEFDNAS